VHSNHRTKNKIFVLVWMLLAFSPPFKLIGNSEQSFSRSLERPVCFVQYELLY